MIAITPIKTSDFFLVDSDFILTSRKKKIKKNRKSAPDFFSFTIPPRWDIMEKEK